MVKFLVLLGLVCLTAGSRIPSSRIVGGQPADPNEWTWQVSLQRRSLFTWSHICGGSLINQNAVLTAAHCVDGTSTTRLRVVAGLHQLNYMNDATTSGVSEIIMHPDYNSNADGFPNDIAILKLETSITESEKMSAVDLASEVSGSFTGNTDCWITGWGQTHANSGLSDTLMEAKMGVIDNDKCQESWSVIQDAVVLESHICVEATDKSACNGDSGGPLVCLAENGKFVLAGVTSWGYSTCENYPSVYGRVSKFNQWINENM